MDNLALLEERVDALVDRLEKAVRQNDELRQKLNRLQEEYQIEVKNLRGENAQLTEKVTALSQESDKLQMEVLESDEREDQVRTRLQSLLKKIDTMEEVLAGQAVAE